MSRTVRAYVPTTLSRLRAAREAGRLGPAPVLGHAVTAELEAAGGGADVEELEYIATTAAALDALRLLSEQEPMLRAVAAVDVGAGEVVAGELSHVRLPQVPLSRLAAVLVDSPNAAADVAAARAALADGAGEDDPAVERCRDHDLLWYAAQELGSLLDEPPA